MRSLASKLPVMRKTGWCLSARERLDRMLYAEKALLGDMLTGLGSLMVCSLFDYAKPSKDSRPRWLVLDRSERKRSVAKRLFRDSCGEVWWRLVAGGLDRVWSWLGQRVVPEAKC